jgi:FixJ family two-component response regulator
MTVLDPTVFVIDDDPSVRKGLARLLRSLGFNTETFASAELFLAREPFEGIGCIVLDVRMPGRSGMDLQEDLNEANPGMPIIFITGHGTIPMTVQAIKRGAVDFLTKPFDDHELLEAIEKAIDKDRKAKAEHARVQAIRERIDTLTPREQEILRYVIAGMLNKQVGLNLDIAEKTVKIHRGRIMEKLGVDSVADLVRLAEKAGIRPAKEKKEQ